MRDGFFCKNLRWRILQNQTEIVRASLQGKDYFCLAGLKGAAPYLGTGVKRPVQVEGETPPSEVNAMRHFVLGIIRRKTLTVSAKCVSARSRRISKKRQEPERKGKS